MDRKIGRLFLVLAALAILAAFAWLIRPGTTAASPKPLPNPNGYNDLVKAGQMLAGDVSDYDEMGYGALRTLVEMNTNALRQARAGLREECRVPLQFSQEYMSNHMAELAPLRRLAQTLVAEGKLAEMEEHPGDAAKSYLDTIHLGTESPRGGLLIDQLVGTAIEALGTSHLEKSSVRLDAKSCREAAAVLETLDAQRQSWNDVLNQEHTWSRRSFAGFAQRLAALVLFGSLKEVEEWAGNKFKVQQMKTRRLMVDLAARACQLEKGGPPSSLADLVPHYLKTMPLDPFTGSNLDYTP
jgi:hypothetical protein